MGFLHHHFATVPAFLSLLLLALPASVTAQSIEPRTPDAGSGTPCAILGAGGTVYDINDCAQLISTGMLVSADRWTLVAGRRYTFSVRQAPNAGLGTPEGRLKGDVATSRKNSSSAGRPGLASRRSGMPIALVRDSDRVVMVRGVTSVSGRLELEIPITATGMFRLVGFPWTGVVPVNEMQVCDGAGNCFDYCPLPSMPSTLEPMCADDPPLAIVIVPPPPASVPAAH